MSSGQAPHKTDVLSLWASEKGGLDWTVHDPSWTGPEDVLPRGKPAFHSNESTAASKTVSGQAEQAGKQEKGNIANLWQDFTATTAFHGFNKLNYMQHLTLRSLYWSLAVLGMTAFMVYNVAVEVVHYYQYPTLTDVKVELVQELAFPAVTICSLSPLNGTAFERTEAHRQYLLNLSPLAVLAYRELNWSSPAFNTSEFTEPQSVESVALSSMTLDQTLGLCLFEGRHHPCAEIFTPVPTDDGVCYTFNGNASDVIKTQLTGSNNHLKVFALAHQKHYSYQSEMSAGFKIYLHNPGEVPLSTTQQVFASAGFSTQIAIQTIQYKYLPTPFMAFGNRKCLDTKGKDFVNPLRHFREYTYSQCMLECRAAFVLERCNCTLLSDPPFGENCNLKQIAVCYLFVRGEFETNVTAKQQCGCLKECQFEQYSTQVSSANYPSNKWGDFLTQYKMIPNITWARDNAVELRIYFNSMMVTSVTQKPEVTFQTIMGNLGGQMGLCLGASILTLSELAEFLYFVGLAIFKRVRDPNRVQRLST